MKVYLISPMSFPEMNLKNIITKVYELLFLEILLEQKNINQNSDEIWVII